MLQCLIYYRFGPQVCVGNSCLRIFGVVPCRGGVRHHLTAHTPHTSTARH